MKKERKRKRETGAEWKTRWICSFFLDLDLDPHRKKKKKKLSLSLSPLFLPIIIIYLLTHLIHAGMRSTHSPYAVSTLALTLVR